MGTYALGVRTVARNTASAAAEVRATSANTPRLLMLEFTQTAAPTSAAVYGLGRPAAIGIAPSVTVYDLDEQLGASINALANTATAWGTGPTVPANFFRRCTVNNIAGAGQRWNFPRGLLIAVSTSLVLWIISTQTPSDLDLHGLVDE